MSKTAKYFMKDVCKLSFQAELKRLDKLNNSSILYKSLTAQQINQLAIKIGLLPSEYRNILFFRYCFNNTPSETDKILESENAINKLRYVQKMLSGLMGLENSWIDDNSMKRACQIGLIEDTKDYDNVEILHKPNYSKAFRLKLKDIKIKQNFDSILMLVAKRVAVFILVCILSFSAVLAANAEAREKVFDWIIEVFPKFNIFMSQKTDDNSISVDLHSFKIKYIPSGFELDDTHENQNMIIYEYSTVHTQRLTIKFVNISSESKSYYDTENVEIEDVIFKGHQAYTWETDAIIHLLWSQEGVEFHISADLDLSKDEIFKIAENISK